MNIILNNNIAIYVTLLILFGSLIVRSNYVKVNDAYLSKNNTDILKGISVLVVIFCHIAMFCTNNSIMKTIFINSGILAVSIFFFTSGYGLMVQYMKKENYLKGFWKKIFKLVLLFLISNIFTTIVANVFLNVNYGIKDIILSSLKFQFSNGRELWFVACIIFMYISFYISFGKLKSKGFIGIISLTIIYVIICILLGKGNWWYNCVYSFPLGMLFAKYNKEILDFYKRNYFLKLIISLTLFLTVMYLYIKGYVILQYVIPLLFVLFVTLVLIKVKLKSRIFLFLNNISFEMYLTHLVILQVAFCEPISRDSIYLVLLFPIMILVAILIQRICNLLLKLFRLT